MSDSAYHLPLFQLNVEYDILHFKENIEQNNKHLWSKVSEQQHMMEYLLNDGSNNFFIAQFYLSSCYS